MGHGSCLRGKRWVLPCLAGLAAAVTVHGVAAADEPVPPPERPFEVVLDDVLQGDLVMAGNSSLLSAGGWNRPGAIAADVDGDASRLCVGRSVGLAVCADNSSSATLDIPVGARIVHARLYVETTVSVGVGQVRVRLDGPDVESNYTELGTATPETPKLYEAAGSGRVGATLRQAVWDVTDYVATAGPGAYTVADIVSERVGPWLPYASWAIVVAYEFDPGSGVVLGGLTAEQQQRFARRAVTWHDGFVFQPEGRREVAIAGFDVVPGAPVFAKSFHIVAHAQQGSSDNLLFDGGPLGNNQTPGDAPPPPGVVLGSDPSCNNTTDVLNDTICVLGSPVATKDPGATDFVASADGVTATSGSAVDMDVIRIPDRYLRTGSSSATLAIQSIGDDSLAPGMLAVSIDQPGVRL